MGQIDRNDRAGLDDLYFAKRVAVLAEESLIEYNGDLNQMKCEIRLPQKAKSDIETGERMQRLNEFIADLMNSDKTDVK